MKNKT